MRHLVGELPLLLHVQVHVDWEDGVLQRIEAGLKVAVAAQLLRLQFPELLQKISLLRLREARQE